MRFVLVILVVLICAGPAFSQREAPSVSATPLEQSVEAEIHAVENGLYSVVIVKSDPHAGRSLVEEMQRRHVPAVSIAVIHDGKLRFRITARVRSIRLL